MESSPPSVPTAANVVHFCKKTIQELQGWYSSRPTDPESYLMNRQQCGYLVKRLLDTDVVLQESPVFDENASLALQELHGVLQHAESLIKASYITTTPQLLRAALEQGDMKETFSKLLYDVQWHTLVLQSILVVSSGDHVTFDREMCNVQLDGDDESHLLKANKEDEKSLKDRLGSLELDDVRLEHDAETEHAKQVLIHLKTVQDESSSAVGENREEAKGLPKVVVQNLKTYFESGETIGRGGFGVVRKTKFLDGKYAVKIKSSRIVRREMLPALKLGHHPHTVPLLCNSEDDRRCYLIMEEMQMPLHDLLEERELLDVEAVDLMLQIAERH
jgi:hypothetical protein